MSECFFLSFSMLGFALLFLTSKPVTLGSTVMAAGVSLALSNVYGDRNIHLKETLLNACGATFDDTAYGPEKVSATAVAQLCAYKAISLFPVGGTRIE